jgi:hypothetical protein
MVEFREMGCEDMLSRLAQSALGVSEFILSA